MTATRAGRIRPALLLLAAASASAVAAQTDTDDRWVPVQGRVVDADGKPVAGVVVAAFWTFDDGPDPVGHGEVLAWRETEHGQEVAERQDLRTDADGRFAGRIGCQRGQAVLLALSADGTLGGSATVSATVSADVDKRGTNDTLQITLLPTVRVHGSFVCEELAGGARWTNVYLSALPSRHRLASCSSDNARFDLRLPPGRYELDAYGAGLRDLRRPLKLTADQLDLDLGEIELRAEYLALMRGKELPEWHVTDARGVALEDATLAHYRGKWLLVEFWGYW